ncbi:MAG: ArnT family glycosyltransferase [Phycisphaerales bacterium]
MSDSTPSGRGPLAALASLRMVALIVLGVTLVRLAYLAFACPFALVEDEAHYWDWSRRLDGSYYTKGPGIALLIATTTRMFGDNAFGVRAGAPICAGLAALAVAALTLGLCRMDKSFDEAGERRSVLFATAALLLAPVTQVTALLSTIDGPYCTCWAVAALAGWWVLRHPAPGQRHSAHMLGWAGLGAALGVGFLFKYTILLLPPGLLLFAMLERRATPRADRRPLPIAGPVVATMVFIACVLPVLLWNQQHGWPTLQHLLGHLGFKESATLSGPVSSTVPLLSRIAQAPLNVLELVATQLLFAGPLLVLAVVAAVRPSLLGASAPGRAARLFLTCCATPIIGFYLVVALATRPEGNWPMAALMTLLPLAGLVADGAMREHGARVRAWLALAPALRPRSGFLRARPESLTQIITHAGFAAGVVFALAVLLAQPLLALLPSWAGRESRISQGRLMADAAEMQREALRRRTEREPLLMAQHYGRASQLAFYLRGQPFVYCTNSRQGGRPTAQDFWPERSLDDPALRRRDALLVGGSLEEWSLVFEQVEPLGLMPGVERKGVHGWVGLGFRGFPTAPRTVGPALQESTR